MTSARTKFLIGGALVLGTAGYLMATSIQETGTYYLTPTELLGRGQAAMGETVRLGGQVAMGSVEGPATDLTFVLTDGESEITVHSNAAPTRSFREGGGAVVEGRLGVNGVFEANRVIVKHDENYQAPEPGTQPSDRAFDPGE